MMFGFKHDHWVSLLSWFTYLWLCIGVPKWMGLFETTFAGCSRLYFLHAFHINHTFLLYLSRKKMPTIYSRWLSGLKYQGRPCAPPILLVQTSGLDLVCYKLKIHPQKATTTKWKTRGGKYQHKLATKCHAQGLLFILIIQHVIYSFVADHSVATKLVSQFRAWNSFCSYSICLLLDYLPPSETTKCFPGQTAHCYKMFGVFYVITCYPKKRSYKMVAQPNHINPHTPSKKLVCYKMRALRSLLEPCFTSKMA